LNPLVKPTTLAGMKSLARPVILAILLFGLSPFAHADEATKAAKIEEMLAITHADTMIKQVMAQMQPMMAEQMKKLNLPDDARAAAEEMQKKMTALIAEKLSWENLKPSFIKIYSETFSEEEIGGIVDFYKSPAGQALTNKMPQLMQKSMAITQNLMSELMPEIAKMSEELSKKYKKQ
jgi:hypothetical protein